MSIPENDYLETIGPQIRRLGFHAAMVLGGSYDDRQSNDLPKTKIKDIDLLMLIAGQENFLNFVSKHQDDLDEMLKIVKPERHFSVKDLEPLYQGCADSIRYSGIDELGRKISVKILESGYLDKVFRDEKPGRINVLSKKDRRFYPHKTIDGQKLFFGVINQKTSTGLTILGDPDLFAIKKNYALGVIADIFISGKLLFEGDEINTADLKRALVNKISRLSFELFRSLPEDWAKILIRSDRVPESFRSQLNRELRELLKSEFPVMPKRLRVTVSPEFNICHVSPVLARYRKQYSLSKKNDQKIAEYRYIKSSGPFSSNSNYGVAVFADGKTSFFKEMLNEFRFRSEIYGLLTTSTYFGHLQQPLYTNPEKNLIAYEWNSGDILARKRLGNISDDIFEELMELELRRAEDHLNAYLLSATDVSRGLIPKDEIYGSRIHDLYYGRLRGNRLRKFYGNFFVRIGDRKVSFFSLLDMDPVINGIRYKPISSMIESAIAHLNPERFRDKLLVCGLGDAHYGNVMVSDGGLDDYLYVDYEFAGFHSPYLDIAKAIYNDCFFGIFYIDKLQPQKFSVDISINGNDMIINHDYKLDRLSRYLLKTKVEGIVLPMRDYLAGKGVGIDNDWERTLGYAMLPCGLLTRNLSEFGQVGFILNLANTIEATSFEAYYKKVVFQ